MMKLYRLTSRGREVVSKFYSDMGTPPPASIAVALAPVATPPAAISSTPVTARAPSSAGPATPPLRPILPSIPPSTTRDGNGNAPPLTPQPSMRPLDIGSSPSTPRAAQHPLVREVRGQQDEADKSMPHYIFIARCLSFISTL